uniref:Uncharacterized protein n=1 Tax=Lactuca sativa TaxID=4236 RepID=A0A9R1UGQ0_LACSA|nr:hypothetical protein LSAT_V11C900475830 [Lactuca sativa]
METSGVFQRIVWMNFREKTIISVKGRRGLDIKSRKTTDSSARKAESSSSPAPPLSTLSNFRESEMSGVRSTISSPSTTISSSLSSLNELKSNIFADNLVETKDDLLKIFSTGSNYIKSISEGKTIQQIVPSSYNNESNGTLKANCSELEVVRVEGTSMGLLYCRLVSLVILLVDGNIFTIKQ